VTGLGFVVDDADLPLLGALVQRGDDPARAIREMRNRKPRSKRTVDYQIVAAQLRARGRSN